MKMQYIVTVYNGKNNNYIDQLLQCNTSSVLFTEQGQNIKINDVMVAGQDVKETYQREEETVNSTSATNIMVI